MVSRLFAVTAGILMALVLGKVADMLFTLDEGVINVFENSTNTTAARFYPDKEAYTAALIGSVIVILAVVVILVIATAIRRSEEWG